MSTTKELEMVQSSHAAGQSDTPRAGHLTLRRETVSHLRIKTGVKTGLRVALEAGTVGCPTCGTGCSDLAR